MHNVLACVCAVEHYATFLSQRHLSDIEAIVAHVDPLRHFPIVIKYVPSDLQPPVVSSHLTPRVAMASVLVLIDWNHELGAALLAKPAVHVSLLDAAAQAVQKQYLDGRGRPAGLVRMERVESKQRCTSSHVGQLCKPHVHARLSNLPICPELSRTMMPRANDVGLLLSVSGAPKEPSSQQYVRQLTWR